MTVVKPVCQAGVGVVGVAAVVAGDGVVAVVVIVGGPKRCGHVAVAVVVRAWRGAGVDLAGGEVARICQAAVPRYPAGACCCSRSGCKAVASHSQVRHHSK